MRLSDIDKWLEDTKTEKDKEYEEAILESETLEDIEELDEEEDL
jgi:hypothetical protein